MVTRDSYYQYVIRIEFNEKSNIFERNGIDEDIGKIIQRFIQSNFVNVSCGCHV